MVDEIRPDDFKVSVGRKEKATTGRTSKKPTKASLAGLLASCNFVVTISGYQEYAFSNDEIDALADALYDVIVQYPTAAKFLIEGGKLSPWLTLSIVAFPMLTKRVAIYQSKQNKTPENVTPFPGFGVFPNGSNTSEDETGTTHSPNRNDGERENGTGEGFYIPSQMGDGS